MKRHGSLIGLEPEKIAEYKCLHAAVWPDILSTTAMLEPVFFDSNVFLYAYSIDPADGKKGVRARELLSSFPFDHLTIVTPFA